MNSTNNPYNDFRFTPVARLIANFEGFRSKPYLCPSGTWSIGFGHTRSITKNTCPITLDQAYLYMSDDIDAVHSQLVQLNFPIDQFNEYQRASIISLCFNVGVASFMSYSVSAFLLIYIKHRATLPKRCVDVLKEVIVERWNTINKIRVNGKLELSNGLVNRRKEESNYFLKHSNISFD